MPFLRRLLACSLALASLLTVSVANASQPETAPDVGGWVLGSGLICDTRDQAERFVSLLDDGVESALGIVNREAGTPNACLVATTGFKRGSTVSEILRGGAIFDVIEITVVVVNTQLGLQPVEPKTYFSVIRTGDRIA